MFIVYDVETTGFASKEIPYNHPAQARIVQLAFIVLDNKMNEVLSYKSLIKPNGKWTIPLKVQEIHGFDNAHCQKHGVDIKFAMSVFLAAASNCVYQVAHNLQFDEQLITIESLHTESVALTQSLKSICTMQRMTPICKILQTTRKGFKWPKLAEAYKFVTGKELEKAHDALADVRGCSELLKYLINNKQVTI